MACTMISQRASAPWTGTQPSDTMTVTQQFQRVTIVLSVVQRGLAPRVFEYIFKRIAEEEDSAVSPSLCWLSDVT